MNRIEQRDASSRWYFAVALLCLSISSCSVKPEDAILGRWKEIGGAERMELFKDGTLTVANQAGHAGGKYSFVDPQRIKVEMGGIFALAGPIIVTVSISDNELTWTMPDGKASKYQREK